MIESNSYNELLKHKGLKNTRHRNSVLEVLEKSSQPMTAEKIFFELKELNVSINLSTVYRVLEVLLEKGLVIKSSITGDSKSLFEIKDSEHKHHIICSGCRKMLPVDGCPLEAYEKLLADKLGFDVTGHRLEIYGVCGECKGTGKVKQNN